MQIFKLSPANTWPLLRIFLLSALRREESERYLRRLVGAAGEEVGKLDAL